MYDVERYAILILRGEKHPQIGSLADPRQTGVQLAMGKNRICQVEDDLVQGEPLAAVEGRCVSESQGELATLDRPARVLRVKAEADSGEVERLVDGRGG